MNELLRNVKKYVEPDEQILSFVIGIFEKDNMFLSYQHGIFVATNRRILFYGKLPYYPAKWEEYFYLYIEDVCVSPHLSFTYRGENVVGRYIERGNVKQFVYAVKREMNN
ncbi:PH domain-containing protein [Bacillus gaemokensis]|uniref:Translation initiation factor, aIF-2BI n=1 Tax=Bacillus gaemokensis TaxID=574375 RepID=A0A073KJ50_9BACI|nr:PH domain-containing protein [Bacillus gaemokensis]KEK22363.1 translation initiation factor, aIF-2BI [Bacillus gaemokensis]KYG36735.1 translation initiation factor, aIF-2BI [Bacillus gaemokensis]